MKLLPLWIIALLVVAPITAGSEVYSFTKADFGTFKKAVDLSDVYTEKALKIRITALDTLAGSESEWQTAEVGFGDSSQSYSGTSDLAFYVEVAFNNQGLKKVAFVVGTTTIAQKTAPEDIPSELTIEIENGMVKCKELGIEDYGIGQLTINAIYLRSVFNNTDGGVGGWQSGYITVELSKDVGFTAIWGPIKPAIKLYIYFAVLALVIGTLVGALNKAFRW